MALKIGRGGLTPPFIVMDVISAANARAQSLPPGMPGVIRMEVGQPSTGAPAGAIEAAKQALGSGDPLGYTEAFGLPVLRERIAAHIRDWYDIEVPVSRIAVTVGASGAFPLAFLAAFNPGDRVALAAPYYPPYLNILKALGLEPVVIETGPDTRYQPDLAALEALDPRPDGLIIASPCNPAGTMLLPDELKALAEWCEREGVRLISDEIYHGLQYETPLSTASAFSSSAIVINSFSKYFSMTGWRVGWMVLPEDLVRPVERLAQNLFISAPHISQRAALAAFDCTAELEANLDRFRCNRLELLANLPRCGFARLSQAQGAFYIYADISGRTGDSAAFCTRMLDELGIAVTPGLDFDAARGHRTMRFSYCGAESDVKEAVERLSGWR
ncbi:pyridoxal phosphate-dependent aminotransferase [Granulibacter bethesdensis]|uniref:Aminotransferase n=1 Tax=Granulibacter bethesdensis (strain ATCC BAA-1260 / CGDNIH1) TaxID=391165 RepID=Q0BV74_GRABC|nr:aminotransferase class I/II-fold pyridoxal phosphate-dependent enzyme [Granulibacter bethesdensis]ABI61278.1 Aspartate aminotransferase [Granulibacter bethesdensis CGDNIH1]AHJ67390.1 Aspartate aminotransferase [Granulibacter bethesdensis]APH51064.1 Aspartate aminotransferase [Granulibacter bethesdensis]APH63758.1 Aspartate aminotransferase [Granulibacter bethesdensis]